MNSRWFCAPRATMVFLTLLAMQGSATALDREVTISAYQGECRDGDFEANLVTARRVIGEAVARGSDFVVFPETFLSGYITREQMMRGARSVEDTDLRAFIAESASHSTVVLIGLARKTAEGIYNSVLVIHRGHLLGIYDKIMLTGTDRNTLKFLPGGEMPVFSAHGARFAVIICHDSSFPHPALIARLKGAEIFFSPHYNDLPADRMNAHRKWVQNCHIGLACQMKMVVVRSNVVVKTGERLGYGQSFIISPRGEMLAEADLFRTELITAKAGPALFKTPYVWADLNEVPQRIRAMLAELLTNPSKP